VTGRLGILVIHHKNFPRVLETIGSLRAQAPDAALLVVDNSEDPAVLAELTDALGPATDVLSVPNGGYGDAANRGFAHLRERVPELEHVLVSTHEALPEPAAVDQLVAALDRDATLGVVGPALVHDVAGERRIWSQGGYLTRWLNEPRHHGAGRAPERVSSTDLVVVPRAWVDGAFCLYRAEVFDRLQFRTDFFLYYEETDLHMRLAQAGYGVACVLSAVVAQESNGVPPYYLGRNLQLFEMAHGRRRHRLLSVPGIAARRAARRLLRRQGPPRELREIARGWWEAVR
jgi:GT2 family glycosyltransferase